MNEVMAGIAPTHPDQVRRSYASAIRNKVTREAVVYGVDVGFGQLNTGHAKVGDIIWLQGTVVSRGAASTVVELVPATGAKRARAALLQPAGRSPALEPGDKFIMLARYLGRAGAQPKLETVVVLEHFPASASR